MLPSFTLFGETIYSYPLLMGIIWASAFQYIQKIIHDRELKFPYFTPFFLCLFIGAWMGSKVLFYLTQNHYSAETLLQNSNFWFGGGLVFYGGVIGGALVTLIYKALFKVDWKNFSYFVIPLALGHSIGRIACFLAGCCYGTHCDLPWAINQHGALRHPVALYESFSVFILFLVLRARYQKRQSLVVQYLGGYAIIRFILEFFRGDKIRGEYFELFSTSQVISIVILFAITFYSLSRKK